MKVDLHKEDSNISSNSFETFDTWRNKFRESITKEFERELEVIYYLSNYRMSLLMFTFIIKLTEGKSTNA